jgi:hypothetical protein
MISLLILDMKLVSLNYALCQKVFFVDKEMLA